MAAIVDYTDPALRRKTVYYHGFISIPQDFSCGYSIISHSPVIYLPLLEELRSVDRPINEREELGIRIRYRATSAGTGLTNSGNPIEDHLNTERRKYTGLTFTVSGTTRTKQANCYEYTGFLTIQGTVSAIRNLGNAIDYRVKTAYESQQAQIEANRKMAEKVRLVEPIIQKLTNTTLVEQMLTAILSPGYHTEDISRFSRKGDVAECLSLTIDTTKYATHQNLGDSESSGRSYRFSDIGYKLTSPMAHIAVAALYGRYIQANFGFRYELSENSSPESVYVHLIVPASPERPRTLTSI